MNKCLPKLMGILVTLQPVEMMNQYLKYLFWCKMTEDGPAICEMAEKVEVSYGPSHTSRKSLHISGKSVP
jgi:hypothetical protein